VTEVSRADADGLELVGWLLARSASVNIRTERQ